MLSKIVKCSECRWLHKDGEYAFCKHEKGFRSIDDIQSYYCAYGKKVNPPKNAPKGVVVCPDCVYCSKTNGILYCDLIGSITDVPFKVDEDFYCADGLEKENA